MGRIDVMKVLSRAWELLVREPLKLVLFALLGSILSVTVVLAPFMAAGTVNVVGRVARREEPELADLFQPFKEFERYLIGALVWLGAQLIGIVIGMAIPPIGTIVSLAVNAFLLCFIPLMVFRRMDGSDAFGACRELFARQWPMLLVVSAIMTVLYWLGVVTLLLGFIVIVPFLFTLMVAVYEEVYGRDDSETVVEGEVEFEPDPEPEAGAEPESEEKA